MSMNPGNRVRPVRSITCTGAGGFTNESKTRVMRPSSIRTPAGSDVRPGKTMRALRSNTASLMNANARGDHRGHSGLALIVTRRLEIQLRAELHDARIAEAGNRPDS